MPLSRLPGGITGYTLLNIYGRNQGMRSTRILWGKEKAPDRSWTVWGFVLQGVPAPNPAKPYGLPRRESLKYLS